jgi:hypothetical protein
MAGVRQLLDKSTDEVAQLCRWAKAEYDAHISDLFMDLRPRKRPRLVGDGPGRQIPQPRAQSPPSFLSAPTDQPIASPDLQPSAAPSYTLSARPLVTKAPAELRKRNAEAEGAMSTAAGGLVFDSAPPPSVAGSAVFTGSTLPSSLQPNTAATPESSSSSSVAVVTQATPSGAAASSGSGGLSSSTEAAIIGGAIGMFELPFAFAFLISTCPLLVHSLSNRAEANGHIYH